MTPSALCAQAGRPEGRRLLEGRHSMGLASRWGSAPWLSTAGPEETIPPLLELLCFIFTETM